MIEDHRLLALEDYSGRYPLIGLEINWSSAVDKCRYLKVKIGDQEAVVARDELLATLFLLATDTQQKDFVPTQLTTNRYLETDVTLTATKNIMKGEPVHAHIKIKIPKKQITKSIFTHST